MLDANKTRHPHNAIKLLEHQWETWEMGTTYTPKNCYKLVLRNNETAYQQVFNRISYLAKVDSKQQRAGTTNDYSTSRIKPKQQM
jgi:hypothetical protein